MIRQSYNRWISCLRPRNMLNREIPVAAHLPSDGGSGIDALDGPAGGLHFVEAGMSDTGNEAPIGHQHARDFFNRGIGIGNVHEGHVAHDQIEGAIFQHHQISGIGDMIGDAERLPGLAGPCALDDCAAAVDADDVAAGPRKPAADVAVAAGEIEHPLPGDVAGEPEGCWVDEGAMPEIAAVAKLVLIPPSSAPS